MKTPVTLLCFNRPELTQRVFDRIAQAKPPVLLVVADGPRPAVSSDAELCKQVRAIVSKPQWDCKLITHFSETNLGCKNRVSSGISWVFEQVERSIFLEDDCLPDPSFFPYCEELLERYKDDERVMNISGNHLISDPDPLDPYSYSFSRYSFIWGWASWRRAWQHYDIEMKLWPEVKSRRLLQAIFPNPQDHEYFLEQFQAVYDGKINTWDYQWLLSCLIQNGLTILPRKNLISNIGFGAGATHTPDSVDSRLVNQPTYPMEFPLKHPSYIFRSIEQDHEKQKAIFRFAIKSLLKRKVMKAWA